MQISNLTKQYQQITPLLSSSLEISVTLTFPPHIHFAKQSQMEPDPANMEDVEAVDNFETGQLGDSDIRVVYSPSAVVQQNDAFAEQPALFCVHRLEYVEKMSVPEICTEEESDRE
jgi:hypothetical protein